MELLFIVILLYIGLLFKLLYAQACLTTLPLSRIFLITGRKANVKLVVF